MWSLNDLEVCIQELDEEEIIGRFQKLVQFDLVNSWQHD